MRGMVALTGLLGAILLGRVAAAGAPAGLPDAPAGRVPQAIEFRLWIVALGSPVRAERLAASSLPAGGRLRVTFADGAPDLARAVSELLASSRQAVAVAVQGQEGGVGTLLGSLGYPVRLTLRTGPVVPPQAGVEPPDLREAALSLELMPLSVDPDGRILTRVTLQLGGGPGPHSSYSHTLWLDERAAVPLAFLWSDPAGPAGRASAAGEANGLATPAGPASVRSAAAVMTDGAAPVYAFGVSARLADAAARASAAVRVAEVGPLEESFFRILGNRHEVRPARPASPAFAIGVDSWLSQDVPLWRLELTQPLWEGGWTLEAALAWAEPPAEVEGRAALRLPLVHELAILAEGSARLSSGGELVSPMLGFGLAEVTYPLPRLSLEGRYLPVVYVRSGSSAWQREPAAWLAGATLRQPGWRLLLEVGRSTRYGLGGGATLSVELGRGFSVHAGYRAFPDANRSFVVAGLQYRPGP